MNSPTPHDIKEARLTAGLTQTQAAALVYASARAWQYWEAGDRDMCPSDWELFSIKASKLQ